MEIKGDLMTKDKNQLIQSTLSAIMFGLVLGAFSMIWPGIIALFLGVLFLFGSCSVEQELAGLSWTEVSHLSITVAPLRRFGLLAMFS